MLYHTVVLQSWVQALLGLMLAVGFSQLPFLRLKKFPLIFALLRTIVFYFLKTEVNGIYMLTDGLCV